LSPNTAATSSLDDNEATKFRLVTETTWPLWNELRTPATAAPNDVERSKIRDHPDLYQLELQFFEDALEITFYDNGRPKPVESLSKGQRATALLPLILRASDQPLIFDQPEDDLDNSFIYRSLAEAVKKLRLHRQLIFVTHNANIPVLGEADRIIVMRMTSATAAAPPIVGTVDECKPTEVLLHIDSITDAFKSWSIIREELLAQAYLVSMLPSKERRQSERRSPEKRPTLTNPPKP
jgi:ABC-type cobalamin/Fe3+-siderophores transport system ATPase subunit